MTIVRNCREGPCGKGIFPVAGNHLELNSEANTCYGG